MAAWRLSAEFVKQLPLNSKICLQVKLLVANLVARTKPMFKLVPHLLHHFKVIKVPANLGQKNF